MPSWLLFTVPAAAISALTCLIAFGTNPVVVRVAGIVGLFSVVAAFVVVPAAIYSLIANRALRTIPQLIGITFCSLPILAMLASFLFGGI